MPLAISRSLVVFAAAVITVVSPKSAVFAQSPTLAEAYISGCGGCHTNESKVLRAIPRLAEAERRVWIEDFMRGHPCEHDTLKPAIVDYLLQKTRR